MRTTLTALAVATAALALPDPAAATCHHINDIWVLTDCLQGEHRLDEIERRERCMQNDLDPDRTLFCL